MFSRIPVLLRVALLPVLLGLPFIGRFYFVDDHYHLLMAKGLLAHPLRPYDFLADDAGPNHAGWERGQPPRMVNPPLHHYLLAVFWKVSGGRLWLVRLLSLFLAGGAAVFLYLLARRFVVPPGPATALAVLTPAFWLSSYALLIDSTLVFFFLGGLWAWIEGLRRGSLRWGAAAGVLMGLAILTKYTAVMLLPLAGLFWWWDRASGRRPVALFALALPLLMLAGWSWWNVETYGAVHLTESSKRVMQSFAWGHVLTYLTFFAGVFVTPLAAWGGAGRRLLRGAGVLAIGLAALFMSPLGGFTPGQATEMAFLAVGGGLFYVLTAAAAFRSRFPLDRFLWVWMAVGAVQMVYVMQWVAARYYLTILPPAVFLTVRLWQERWALFPARFSRACAAAAAALFVFGGALASADYLQAQTGRWILRDVTADGWLARGRTGYFLGDSFTGSALKSAGWISAFPDTPLAPGSLLLHSRVIMPPWWFRGKNLTPVARYEYPSRLPLRVMSNRGAAGFYASVWGALPFTFTGDPLEAYTLFEVTGDAGGR